MKIQDKHHPIYVKACRREALFWEWADDYAEVSIPKRMSEYENQKRTGDKDTDEFDFLKSLWKFSKGLSLGSGGGSYELKLMEEGIVDHFVFIDISEKALETLRHNAEKLWVADRIETRIQDFNFLELPESTYDLVSCQNMLHHIVNLEECMDSINRSLTSSWIFVTNECIGENKMYWTDAKMWFVKVIQWLLHEKGIETKEYLRTNPDVLTNNCPFECVRSWDLHDIITHYFGKSIVRESAFGHLQHMWHGLTDNRSDEYFDLLELLDGFVAENTLLQANRLFGVYKKSHVWLMHTTPWTDKEMADNIWVNAISERGLMQWWEKIKKRFPALYNTMKRLYFKVR